MNDIYFKSNDNITNIHGIIWEPNGNIKGIVHIIHGMGEYIEKYDKIAKILNKNGYIVVGTDLLGHGKSVIDKDHYGYFASSNSTNILLEDTKTFINLIKNKYKGFSYFLMGYSFGSILTRYFVYDNSSLIDGIILISAPYHSNIKMVGAKILTNIIQIYNHGWFYRSNFIYKFSNGGYNKYFKNSEYKSWLTKNNDILKEWNNAPYEKFIWTCNGYYTMFKLLKTTNKNIKKIRKNLPILILCGKDDPASHFGKDAIKIKNRYVKNGINNVKVKEYNNLRHAILFDYETPIVMNDLINFLNLNIIKRSKK